MGKMFAEYQALVLEEYREKTEAGVLSFRLMSPSPANLRDECAAVCRERFGKKDERILRDFFGQQKDAAGYLHAIEACPVSRFKPLLNFIRGQILTPDERNVELLAWLIDFSPRPWQLGWSKIPGAEKVEKKKEEDTDPENREEENRDLAGSIGAEEALGSRTMAASPAAGKEEKKQSGKRKVIAAFLLLLGAAGGYVSLQNKASSRPDGAAGCMYWTGDHYERISCIRHTDDTIVVPFDEIKFQQHKKINREDTITYQSIGWVWYIKVNGKPEFYTFGGRYPKNAQQWLRPLTRYMIDKYILQKKK